MNCCRGIRCRVVAEEISRVARARDSSCRREDLSQLHPQPYVALSVERSPLHPLLGIPLATVMCVRKTKVHRTAPRMSSQCQAPGSFIC